MNKTAQKQKGFTLIEVIMTIIIASLAGLVVFTYLGNVLTRSAEPLHQVKALAEAVEVMEGFAAEYRRYLAEDVAWGTFTATLTGAGISAVQLENDPFNVTFEVYEVTITRNNQTISALFTQ